MSKAEVDFLKRPLRFERPFNKFCFRSNGWDFRHSREIVQKKTLTAFIAALRFNSGLSAEEASSNPTEKK